MSYNGSGTFVINTTGQPVVTGTPISSTVFNALTADLATGLSTAITKDGQTATTARIPFAQGISSTLVTDSTSTTTGSIITAGGAGVAKALFVGTTANVAGAVTLQSTLGVTGITTFSAQPIFSSLTASSAVATDASKGLVSVTNTGTGNNVLATSPTLTGTIAGASLSLSSLTSGRVPYATTAGLLTDSANLLYSGTDLGVYGLTVGRGAGAVATNTAVGASALNANTTGANNVAVGYLASDGNTTGIQNVAIGSLALRANTTAGQSVAVGYQAARLQTGGSNVAVGFNSLLGSAGVSTGTSNTAIGTQTLLANTTASDNTAVGYQSAYSNTTGTPIQAFGKWALYGNTTGTFNDAFGFNALGSNTTGSSNVGLGSYALYANTTASNNVAVGYQAAYSNTIGQRVTAIGDKALYTANRTADNDAANTAVGTNAGYLLTTGQYNTFVGLGSGYSMTTGGKNVILGGYSGNQGGLDIRTSSNYIVLSDGDGNPRFYINNDAQSFSSSSVGDFIQKWSLGTTSTDGLIVTYPTVTPNNTSRFFFRGSDSTNTKIDIYSSGTISNRTGTYNTLSDAKLKENIVDATPKLTKLMDVKVRNYNLIGDELKQIGFVAQELEQVFPNLIDNVPDFDENREPTGEVTKGVKLTVMIPILVKAIQEQQALITALTTRITALEAKVGA